VVGRALHGPGQVVLDTRVSLLGVTPKEDHHDEGAGRRYEKVYQGVLMHPVDLSKESSNPVALDAALHAAARRKSDLYGHVVPGLLPINDAVEQPNTSHCDRVHVVSAAIEKRPDQPSAFEPV